jgi:hypothetical protein
VSEGITNERHATKHDIGADNRARQRNEDSG